jgi:hypothetical protein
LSYVIEVPRKFREIYRTFYALEAPRAAFCRQAPTLRRYRGVAKLAYRSGRSSHFFSLWMLQPP